MLASAEGDDGSWALVRAEEWPAYKVGRMWPVNKVRAVLLACLPLARLHRLSKHASQRRQSFASSQLASACEF